MASTFKPVDAKKLLDQIQADPSMNDLLRKAISDSKAEAAKRGITSKSLADEKPILADTKGDRCSGCFSCLACGATPTPDIEVGTLFTAFYVV
jgi:hypothetical protein